MNPPNMSNVVNEVVSNTIGLVGHHLFAQSDHLGIPFYDNDNGRAPARGIYPAMDFWSTT